MKRFRLIVCILAGASLLLISDICRAKDDKKSEEKKTLSEYEKIFDKKENVKTEEGLLKLSLVDEKIIAEIPHDVFGKSMLLHSHVERSSHGKYAPLNTKVGLNFRFVFTHTDSLINIRMKSTHVLSEEENITSALEMSGVDPILYSFPIKTWSPDSTALVCDLTKLFLDKDNIISQIYRTYGQGNIMAGEYKDSDSFVEDIAAFDRHIEVLTSKSYTYKMPGEPVTDVTIQARSVMSMLPEEAMTPKKADPRIGVSSFSLREFTAEGGSKTDKYVRRWRMEPGRTITFYVDTLFTPVWRKGIIDGIEKWNKAFERIGIHNALSAVPYPKNDSTFESAGSQINKVRYIQDDSRDYTINTVVDPRSGEILSTMLNVGRELEFITMQTEALIMTGACNPAVRSNKLPEKELYDAVVAHTMRAMGRCLGLSVNYAAAVAYSVEELRDPEFTKAHGFASSVMTHMNYNYVIQPEDYAQGADPMMRDLGPYDYYAINWLYGSGDQKIIDDPEHKFSGEKSYSSRVDPRYSAYNILSTDPIRAADLYFNNLKYVKDNALDWIYTLDVNESYYGLFPDFVYLQAFNTVSAIYMYLAGYYEEDQLTAAAKGVPTYRPVPMEEQKRALRWLIDKACDMSWIDNKELVRCSELADNMSEHLELNFANGITNHLLGNRINMSAPLADSERIQKELLDCFASELLPRIANSRELKHGELLLLRFYTQRLASQTVKPGLHYKYLQEAKEAARKGASKNRNQEQKDALLYIAEKY